MTVERLEADVIVIGAGLAGLVATAELAAAGRRVLVLEQEPEASLGGQAFWSLGGLFLVDTPEQRRWGVHDSLELAWQDWQGAAGFDRPEDHWPAQWARAYVEFAAGEKRDWLHGLGVRFMPNPGWAERGGYGALGHGNSVPRFHLTWGTGPGVLDPFLARVQAARARGLVTIATRHRVDELILDGAGVGDGIEDEESRALLREAVQSLPERDRIVVTLYYYESLTLAEIGQVLGVTESRVCQLHTKACAALREHLQDALSRNAS